MSTVLAVRELHQRWKTNNCVTNRSALEERARQIAAGLPFRAGVRQATGRPGTVHIVCLESLERGKLKREADALLCGETRFSGLLPTVSTPDCLRCLEIAERLARKGEGE